MKDLNEIVANNLKRIRGEMKLSLEKLADITGVSKAMLRQIETEESSPTINTIWKIASGLKIPYTAIINMPKPDTLVVKGTEIEAQIDGNGKYRVSSIFPSEDGRRFEIYTIELEEEGSFISGPHGEKTEEFITVFEGKLKMSVDGEEYRLDRGDSIRFKADKTHIYCNPSHLLTKACMVIYYPL